MQECGETAGIRCLLWHFWRDKTQIMIFSFTTMLQQVSDKNLKMNKIHKNLPVSRLKNAMTTYPVAGPENANWSRYMFGRNANPYMIISTIIYAGCLFPSAMPENRNQNRFSQQSIQVMFSTWLATKKRIRMYQRRKSKGYMKTHTTNVS